jgi:hypothetical protein
MAIAIIIFLLGFCLTVNATRTQFLVYVLCVSMLAAGSGTYGILVDLVLFYSAPAILLAGFIVAFFWKLLPNRKFDRMI